MRRHCNRALHSHSRAGAPNANITIVDSGGQLLFTLLSQAVLLWWRAQDAFQVYIPPVGYIPCFIDELNAFDHQYVLFQRDGNGDVASVTVPGYYPGVTWLNAALK